MKKRIIALTIAVQTIGTIVYFLFPSYFLTIESNPMIYWIQSYIVRNGITFLSLIGIVFVVLWYLIPILGIMFGKTKKDVVLFVTIPSIISIIFSTTMLVLTVEGNTFIQIVSVFVFPLLLFVILASLKNIIIVVLSVIWLKTLSNEESSVVKKTIVSVLLICIQISLFCGFVIQNERSVSNNSKSYAEFEDIVFTNCELEPCIAHELVRRQELEYYYNHQEYKYLETKILFESNDGFFYISQYENKDLNNTLNVIKKCDKSFDNELELIAITGELTNGNIYKLKKSNILPIEKRDNQSDVNYYYFINDMFYCFFGDKVFAYNIIDNSFIIENSESFNYESIDRVSITFEKHRLVLHYSQESFEIKERDILEKIAKSAGVFVQHISFDNNAELIVSNYNNVYIIVADPVHGTNSLLTRNFILMRIDKENKTIAEVELIQSNVFCLKSFTDK